jgi:hypothetical protein
LPSNEVTACAAALLAYHYGKRSALPLARIQTRLQTFEKTTPFQPVPIEAGQMRWLAPLDTTFAIVQKLQARQASWNTYNKPFQSRPVSVLTGGRAENGPQNP